MALWACCLPARRNLEHPHAGPGCGGTMGTEAGRAKCRSRQLRRALRWMWEEGRVWRPRAQGWACSTLIHEGCLLVRCSCICICSLASTQYRIQKVLVVELFQPHEAASNKDSNPQVSLYRSMHVYLLSERERENVCGWCECVGRCA